MYRNLILVICCLMACRTEPTSEFKGGCLTKIKDPLIEIIERDPSFDYADLPDEIWVKIMSHLDTKEMVQLITVSSRLGSPLSKTLAEKAGNVIPRHHLDEIAKVFERLPPEQHKFYLGTAYLIYLKLMSAPQVPIISKKIDAHKEEIYRVIALSDGMIASASLDRSIKIWNPFNGTQISTLPKAFANKRQMVPLSSGNLVTYIPDSHNGLIEIWDPKTGNPVSFLGEANTGEGVRSILELSDSKLMAAYQNGQIKVWDLSESQLARELPDYFFQLGSKNQLTDKKLVRFEDGPIAFPGRNHTIKIIDSKTFQPIKTLSNLLNGDQQEIRTLIPLRNNKLAVVRMQHIEIWDLQQGSVMKVFQTPEENRVLELADGKLAFFEMLENEPKLLKTWNPKTNEIRNIGSGFIPRYYDLVELPENRLMTVAYDYDKAVIWDLSAQKPLRTIHETHGKKFSAVLLDANQWVLTEQKYSGRLTSLKIFDPWRDVRNVLDEIYREM